MKNDCEHILKQAALAHEEGRLADAEKAYLEILSEKPESGSVLNALGTVLLDQGQPDKAKKYFEKAVNLILVNELEYKTPELLFNLVSPHLKEDLTVLDLGCGTGLGAQFYRPYAKLLIGVDVASKMLQKASEKNIYDDLIVFDILQDWSFPQPFDLIYSSDVFVYFGNLDPIFRSASSYLVQGGIIAFSVERLEDDSTGYHLFPSGCYAHSHRYIRDCLKHHGLAPVEETESVIRKQSGDY